MLRILVTMLALLAASPLAAQPPNWEVVVNDDDSVSILPAVEGFTSAKEALTSVGADRVIREIRLDPKILYGEMQGEIHQYLEEHYPEELARAMESSGNLHNPRVNALAGAFLEAILATSYVAELNELLAGSCQQVNKVSHEKLFMSTKEDPPSFSAIVWLAVEKIACGPA